MKYRKISPCIWNDAKVRELSDKGKLALLFLLTHPHMTPLGAIRGNCPGLACELGWSAKVFRKAFGESLAQGIVREDTRATLIWFPNFLKHNMPESPNVVKSWAGGFDDLPESPLKKAMLKQAAGVVAGLGEGFRNAFQEAFPKGMSNQEQEQEQEQEKRGGVCCAGACACEEASPRADEVPPVREAAGPKKLDSPSKGTPQWAAFLTCWQVYPVQQGKEEAWREWVRLSGNRTLAEPYAIRDAILFLTAEDSRWKRGMVPKMARWLSGKGWEDKPYVEPEPKVQADDGNHRPKANTVAQQQVQNLDLMAKSLLFAREAHNAQSGLHAHDAYKAGHSLPASL